MNAIELISKLFNEIISNMATVYVIVGLSIISWFLEQFIDVPKMPKLQRQLVLLLCFVGGPFFYYRFSTNGAVDPSFPNPVGVRVIHGLVAGLVSYAIHGGVVARLMDKLGGSKQAPTPPTPPTPPSV